MCGHDLLVGQSNEGGAGAGRVQSEGQRAGAGTPRARRRGRRPPNIYTLLTISADSIPSVQAFQENASVLLVDLRMSCYETIYKCCEWRFATSAKVASQHFPVYSVAYSVDTYVNLYMVGYNNGAEQSNHSPFIVFLDIL